MLAIGSLQVNRDFGHECCTISGAWDKSLNSPVPSSVLRVVPAVNRIRRGATLCTAALPRVASRHSPHWLHLPPHVMISGPGSTTPGHPNPRLGSLLSSSPPLGQRPGCASFFSLFLWTAPYAPTVADPPLSTTCNLLFPVGRRTRSVADATQMRINCAAIRARNFPT